MKSINKKILACTAIASLIALSSLSALADDHSMHMNSSENMSGMNEGMNHESMNMDQSDIMKQDATFSAKGRVTSIQLDTKKIKISHEAIPALNWPPMTMNFTYDDAELLDDIKVGDTVYFDFASRGKDFVIMDIIAN